MKNQIIEKFIIEITLIDPITDILNKLNNNEFRSCDITWLNNKVENFTSFALETLNKKFDVDKIGEDIMNDFVKNKFINHFNILLKYFKSFN